MKGIFIMNEKIIYLAGGCFWGIEKLMKSLSGVTEVVSGYANGHTDDPNYREVCKGNTGYRETVRVTYQPDRISLDQILFAFFAVIDPALINQQGNDVGTQYQAGIYYTDEDSHATIRRIAVVEQHRWDSFHVEIDPLTKFYAAEEYHQNYLDKNPSGYCHIPLQEIVKLSKGIIDAGKYQRPAQEILKQRLTLEQYEITQNSGTERPHQNAYWDSHERGIYVDITTGEPLFSSTDKFDSNCGWPSFSQPIDPNVIIYKQDASHSMKRTEVRSRAGDSHLGHVFYGESEPPSDARFCINSAALRFIPLDQMDAEGYGYLKDLAK